MKKLLVLLLVLGLAAPAMAAEWNFYGSARFETYRTTDSVEDYATYDDAWTTWTMPSGSRFGANVKVNDQIGGKVEYGAASSINLRQLFGTYNFGAGVLTVGQTYTPTFFPKSSSGMFDEIDLLGAGTSYAGRLPELMLTFGGFKVALIAPTVGTGALGVYTDSDVTLPKVELSYIFTHQVFNVYGYGGYQTYQLENQAEEESIDINAYIVGAGFDLMFGPVTFSMQGNLGQNYGSYGQITGPYNRAGATLSVYNQPVLDGDDVIASNALQGLAVLGFKINDMFSVEVGGGYVQYTNEEINEDNVASSYHVYGLAHITVVPGFILTPEIGMVDFGSLEEPNDADMGSQLYYGLQWKINF